MMNETILTISLFISTITNARVPLNYYPPPPYDTPFKGEMRVTWTSADEVRKYCPAFGIACTITATPWLCEVYANEDYHHPPIANIILRHENGHCNGWPSTHPRK